MLWALLLFYCMSTIAEAFLVPAVQVGEQLHLYVYRQHGSSTQYMANAMRLPSDIAGVTLFAFATGAPDIFTQLAAINEGQHVDIQLAVSSTLGSGLFIICIVLAIVLLYTPSTIVLNDTTNYVRDAAAYFFACLLVLIVMWDDALQVYEATLLLACYVGYIACCLVTMRSAPSGYQAPTETLDGSPACVQLTAVATGCHAVASVCPTKVSKSDAGHLRYVCCWWYQHYCWWFYTYSARQDEGVGRRRGPRASCEESPGSMLISPRDDMSSPIQRSIQMETLPRKLSKPAMHVPHVHAPEPSPTTPWQRILALLHWSHTPVCLRPLAAVCAPLTLAMHATMPTVAPGAHHAAICVLLQPTTFLCPGRYSRRYCIVLAVCAPALLGVSLGAIGWGLCSALLLWAAASVLLLLLLLTSFREGDDGRAQRANAVFSLLAFVQSMVWMSLLADEVAALFESLGLLLDLQADMLGATLLAWGETFPDLVSSIAIVRTGHSMMAISAAFGGPTLNLLVGTGASVLCAILRKGTVPAELTNGVVMLVATSLVAIFVVLAVPALGEWRLSKRLGWGLVVLYVASLAVFFLSDSQLVVSHVSARRH